MSSISNEENIFKEGLAQFNTNNATFYNPVQQFNRDITIAIIQTYINVNKLENVRILEALAASGLRSIRFALELKNVLEIICNDYSQSAVECIKENIVMNNVQSIIKPNCDDATVLMIKCRKKQNQFDIVDIDPYGCSAQYLDSAVQCIKNGGLLCVTSTDMAILCGNAFETCHAKYGSVSLKSKACHEIALRIVLRSIEAAANRHGKFIEPLVSISVDFYVRIFVKVHYGQKEVKKSVCKLATLYQCTGCSFLQYEKLAQERPNGFAFTRGPTISERCQYCTQKCHIGGPIWINPIHNIVFVKDIILKVNNFLHLGTKARISGMLTLISEELVDIPLYYVLDALTSTLRCIAPSQMVFRSAILNAGYHVSYSHAEKNSVKTNAPLGFLFDLLKRWVKDNPINQRHIKENSVIKYLFDSDCKYPNIDFSLNELAEPESKKKGLVRWQRNPMPDWGPKTRAKKVVNQETEIDKRERNQNKKRRKTDIKT